jgi:hypothetical protein
VRDGRLDGYGLAAIAAYLGCFVTSLYVLLPHELVLEFRGSVAVLLGLEIVLWTASYGDRLL